TVGERAVDKDLDIGISFSSSVEDIEKKNPDPTISDPVTVRERKTRATLDLRLAPFGTRPSILKTWETKETTRDKTGQEQTRTRTSALYSLVTPFFIDAKV